MQKTRILSISLAMTVLLLLMIGILAIYSTTYSVDSNSYLIKQGIWVAAGLVMTIIVGIMPMDYLSKWSKCIFLAVAICLLYLMLANACNEIAIRVFKLNDGVAGLIPLAQFRKGACRWIGAGPITIQPSEFAKFAIILFLSTYYGMRDIQKIESFREGFMIPGFVSFIMLALILLGRSLSNTIITGSIVFMIMFLAGVKLRYLSASFFLALILALLCILYTPYRRQRIFNYIAHNKTETIQTKEKNKADNFQLNRSVCAIGAGGVAGTGIGGGRLKHKSIPESRTDFIFAVVGEELGFLGMIAGIALYLAFMLLSFAIAKQCRDRRGTLICMAVGYFVPFQAMFNLGVICGLFPTTGVTAPLVSYGGSSIVSVMLCIGLVFNVCRQNHLDTVSGRISGSSATDMSIPINTTTQGR